MRHAALDPLHRAQREHEAFPLLVLEEEGLLDDTPLRENPGGRLIAYYRWTETLDEYGPAVLRGLPVFWCDSTLPTC